MGCTQSKIENEEAVTRCKERKQFMKEAVSYRNAFAAAHSAYAVSLKNTGAALSDYTQGEIPHSHHHHPSSSSSSASAAVSAAVAAATSTSVESLPPPPPPLPSFQNTPPLQRAVSMPEMKIPKPESKPMGPTIMEEEEEEEDEEVEFEAEKLTRKRSSNSSSNRGVPDVGPPPQVQSQPQQWKEEVARAPMNHQGSSWGDYIFAPVESMPSHSLAEEPVPPAVVVEEVSKVANLEVEAMPEKEMEKAVEVPVPMPVAVPVEKKAVRKSSGGSGGEVMGRRPGKTLNLMQLFSELDDHFLKASESAHEVSKMLEATRLHYHSNFADNRGNLI